MAPRIAEVAAFGNSLLDMRMKLPPPTDGSTLCINGERHAIADATNKEEYLRYLRMVVAHWNVYAAQIGFRFLLDISEVEKAVHAESYVNDANLISIISQFNANLNSHKGKLHESQIRSIIDIIKNGLSPNSFYITAAGDKQSGKSSVVIGCLIFESPIRYLARGEICKPVYVCPNKKDLHTQVLNEAKECLRYLSQLTIIDSTCNVFAPLPMFYSNLGIDLSLNGDTSNPLKYIQRNAKKSSTVHLDHYEGTQFFRTIIDESKTKKYMPIFYIDESHFGSGIESVFASWAKDVLKNNTVFFRYASATPYETLDPRYHTIVDMWLENGYSGVGAIQGRKLPTIDGFVPKPPRIERYRDYFGFDKILHARAYKNIFSYLSKIVGLTGRELVEAKANVWIYKNEYKHYRKYFINCVVHMIEDCLITKNVLNKPGVFIRLPCSNELANEIMQHVESILKTKGHYITSIPFLDDNSGIEVEKLINNLSQNGDDKYVGYCTAGARMGSHFPASTGYFIDLTLKSATAQAEQQGFFGRACGYFKNSIVFLSDSGFDSISYYIRSGGKLLKRPSERSIKTTNKYRGRPSYNITVYIDTIERFASTHPKCQILIKVMKCLKLCEQLINLESRFGTCWQADPVKHGKSINSERLTPMINLLADAVEKYPSLITDNSGDQMYHKIDMLRFAHDSKLLAKEKIKILKNEKSLYFTDIPHKNGNAMRFPYGPLVGRRKSPETEIDHRDIKNTGHKTTGTHGHVIKSTRTTGQSSSGNKDQMEAQVWLFNPTQHGCMKTMKQLKRNPSYKNNETRIIAFTLVSRTPVAKVYPNEHENYIAKENSQHHGNNLGSYQLHIVSEEDDE